MMQRLGDRVHFLHLRNVSTSGKELFCSFYEDEHLAGNTDMVALLAAVHAEEQRRACSDRRTAGVGTRRPCAQPGRRGSARAPIYDARPSAARSARDRPLARPTTRHPTPSPPLDTQVLNRTGVRACAASKVQMDGSWANGLPGKVYPDSVAKGTLIGRGR